MKRTLFIFLVINLTLSAQGIVNDGLKFLTLGFSARELALGNSGVSDALGTAAIFYNPALLSRAKKKQISFSHHRVMQDVNSESASAIFKLYGQAVGIAVSTTSVTNIEIRTKAGAPQGYFNAHYFLAAISTGFRVYKFLNAGISLKYLYEGLFVDESTGYAMDIGFYSDEILKHFKLGANLKNLGKMNNLRSAPTKLPTSVIIGGTYRLNLNSANINLNTELGAETFLKEGSTHLSIGTELIYRNKFFVRGGYLTGYEAKSFSFGIGFIASIFRLDYAYVPNKYNLGNTHFLTLNINVTNIF